MLETGLLETLKSDDADERTIDEYHQDVTDALYISPRVQPSQSPRGLGLETSRGQPQQLERRQWRMWHSFPDASMHPHSPRVCDCGGRSPRTSTSYGIAGGWR